MSVMDVLSKAVEQDPEAGSALIDQVVYDFMCDLVEVNKAELQQLYGMWALDRVQTAKKALARGYVTSVSKGAYPDDDTQIAAQWLAGIERFVVAAAQGDVVSKNMSEWWDIDGKQKQRRVSRDAKGRFTRGVNQNASRSVSPAESTNKKTRMSPGLRRFVDPQTNTSWTGGVDDNLAASHQGKYEEAVMHANDMKRALGRNMESGAISLLVQGRSGDIRNVTVPMDKVQPLGEGGLSEVDLEPRDSIIGVEVIPKSGASAAEAAKIAEFNLLGGAGGSALAELANANPELRTQLANSLGMPRAADDKSNLSRLFDVLGAGGAVLSEIPGMEKTGQMAALVGTMGPEAEKVLGPYVQRSAYRYRGTEKNPDMELRDPQAGLTEEQIGRIASEFPESSPEQLSMQMRADAAASILMETLPEDPIVARLSEKSGQVLPSQGVMYDADGKLVSQSVGYTDDHYLPFDLSNLARLRGGQYVRTRQQGGMTGEDIYTTVMSGARQAEVVSSSGVFTIHMAPDFRGGRAMSDKARGMYTNYLKILDAVDKSGLYLEDISPQQQFKIRQEVTQLLGEGASDDEIKDMTNRRIDRARAEAMQVDETAASRTALLSLDMSPDTDPQSLRGMNRRRYEDAFEDALDEQRATAANELRLNAEGYSVALETLRQQFPYFIKDVKFRRLSALPSDGRGSAPQSLPYRQDRGYTLPGSLRAKNVRTGFYNPGEIQPRPKRQEAAQEAADSSVPRAANTTGESTPGSSNPTPDAPEVRTQQKAPDTGIQAELNADANIEPMLSKTATGLSVGFSSIPDMDRVSSNLMGAKFGDVADNPAAAARWFMVQPDPNVIQEALSGPFKQKAAEALTDPEVVETALTTLTGGEAFFENGNKIGDGTNVQSATEWVVRQGQDLGDLAAMKDGFAKEPATTKAFVNHRGLMPIMTPTVAPLTTRTKYEEFVADPQNQDVVANAVDLAVDSATGESRGLAEISADVSDQLDAFDQLESGIQQARAASIAGKSDEQAVRSIPRDAWQTIRGESSVDLKQALVMDVDQSKRELQDAWALATAGRVLDIQAGGDVRPKAGGRLLEPVKKEDRRVLMSLANTPIHL